MPPISASAALGRRLCRVLGERLLRTLRRGGASLGGSADGGERFDLSWTDLPDGHTRLSAARRANDVVLRYLYPRVEKVHLHFVRDDLADDVLRRALLVPPTDNPPWRELPVWLTMLPDESAAVVKVGETRVGTADMPQSAWEAMLSEAGRATYADGTLSVSDGTGRGGAVTVGALCCWLPRGPR